MISLSKEELLFMVKACQQAEKFKDMLFYVKQLILQTSEPNIEERNLFSLSFRLNVSENRISWRVACSLEQKDLTQGHPNAHLIVQQRKIIEAELKELCYDCLDFVKNNLLKSSHTAHSRVFFNRMRGDYYRYLADCVNGDEKLEVMDNCVAAYEQAMEIAEAELKVTDPRRLELALSFSVFCHEILGNGARCREIAMKGFDDAFEKIDEIDDEDYKDATAIMQLLRDNVALWEAEEEKSEQAEQVN